MSDASTKDEKEPLLEDKPSETTLNIVRRFKALVRGRAFLPAILSDISRFRAEFLRITQIEYFGVGEEAALKALRLELLQESTVMPRPFNIRDTRRLSLEETVLKTAGIGERVGSFLVQASDSQLSGRGTAIEAYADNKNTERDITNFANVVGPRFIRSPLVRVKILIDKLDRIAAALELFNQRHTQTKIFRKIKWIACGTSFCWLGVVALPAILQLLTLISQDTAKILYIPGALGFIITITFAAAFNEGEVNQANRVGGLQFIEDEGQRAQIKNLLVKLHRYGELQIRPDFLRILLEGAPAELILPSTIEDEAIASLENIWSRTCAWMIFDMVIRDFSTDSAIGAELIFSYLAKLIIGPVGGFQKTTIIHHITIAINELEQVYHKAERNEIITNNLLGGEEVKRMNADIKKQVQEKLYLIATIPHNSIQELVGDTCRHLNIPEPPIAITTQFTSASSSSAPSQIVG